MYYPHVDNILTVIKDSSTIPCDAILSSGQRVIIKLNNNIQGNLSLVNEYICSKLAVHFQLPIPNFGISIVDSQTVDGKKLIVPENYGPCFYSERINHATIVNTSIVNKISNKEEFFRILIFDHLVYNKDRNLGNLLVSMKKNISLYAIDHTHVFKNQCVWDKYCLKQGIKSNDFLDTDIMEYNDDTYSVFFNSINIAEDKLKGTAESFKKNISKNVLEDIILNVPNEWIPSADDLDALVEYLLYRAEHITDTVEVILNYRKR